VATLHHQIVVAASPPSCAGPVPELGFKIEAVNDAALLASGYSYNRYKATNDMFPVIPKELLITAVETVCYFCTAIGVLLTFVFTSRR
jgi:hypothetical protein